MSTPSREQFVAQVIEIVHKRFPLVKIEPADDDFAVRIKPKRERGPGHLASLENLFRMAVLDPDDITHHVERWAVELIRASEGYPDEQGSFDILRERIMPMILPAQFCDEAYESVVSQPLIEGLRVAYAIDSDRTISYIARSHFDEWNLTVEDIHETAIQNLVKRSEEMAANVAQDEDGRISLVVLSQRDGYDASRLLLPTLHARLSEHLDSPFIAAIPHRDILLCFRHDTETVHRLAPQVAEDYRRMPHQVTEQLMIVTPDGVAPYVKA
ncbi:MAG: DUF1444 family protein [Phycisphaerae bacterium]|nr:DUF1444 family protein [Tepidisphaeraceae bacterium]HYE20797.1 DUF1444 family protein [Tepidisphaeraceae bacterium]